MLESVKTWVSNIIAVILFVSIIEIILSDGKMRKYVNLVAGVLVVLIIISPLVRAFNKDFKFEMPEMNLKEPIPIEDLKIKGTELESLRTKQVIETYRAKMESSIRNQVNQFDEVYCEKVVCKVKKNVDSNGLGDIEEIVLYISKKNKNLKNSEIKPIKIEIGKDKKKNVENSEEISEEIKNKIIKDVSYTCRVNPQNIKVLSSGN
ncbi:MAG: stage III sporulation protein AF [Ignavibacteriales bacterium]